VEDFGGAPVGELARQEGVLDYLTIHPRVPRADALRLMSRASVLVSLPQEVDLAIPSKIFEYMQFPARLLALAKPGSATAELLCTTEAVVASPDDVDAITNAIHDGWREFNAGRSPQPINRDGRFGRQAQARILFNALDRLRMS
jgi:hypothetical protein